MRAQQIGRALDGPGPSQADIRAGDCRLPRDQFEPVARLVDAEQRAAQRDLADQAFPVRGMIQMRSGAEQPVVKRAGRHRVGVGEGDVIDPKYAAMDSPCPSPALCAPPRSSICGVAADLSPGIRCNTVLLHPERTLLPTMSTIELVDPELRDALVLWPQV